MAVLGKIRSKGILLVGIIGLGLFAFIAEEAFRSCETTRNDKNQQIAEVLGEKMSYQDFQKMVDEYSDVLKMTQRKDNLTEDELNSVRDQVWNTYLQTKLVEADAKKLGLTVTDEEMRNILNEGTNPLLLQSPFVNQQTGRFDANQLKQFLSEFKKSGQDPQVIQQLQPMYNYWQFIEKTLRQQTLAQKYQVLLAGTFLSNPVEAAQIAKETDIESSVQLVAFPYADVKDVEVSESEIKAKYDELKARFRQYEETRDIKYVAVHIDATASDKSALMKTTQEYVTMMKDAEDPSEAVRKANSQVAYLGVPVLASAYPSDIAALLDSISVGTTTELKENKQDNTINSIRLISREELPDSIEYQAIQVGGATPEEAHNRADSIFNAVKADASQWDALAKKYGQSGEKQWLTTQQYQYAPSIDKDTRTYLNTLNTASVGEVKNIEMTAGNIIVKVTERKAMKKKYVAAVIKTFQNFSKETRTKDYNKFSAFVSQCHSAEDLQKLAPKNQYTVLDNADVTSGQHYVAGIRGTHEALKWIFDAKEGDVSPLYECGNNDAMLVMVLTKIHKVGYRDLSDENVNNYCKEEAIKDKKAAQLIASLSKVKNIAGAKAVKGAKAGELAQVTFASPAFVQLTGAQEPALSGAISATKKGQYCSHPVKGNMGVYVFQVTAQSANAAKTKIDEVQKTVAQRNMQMAGNPIQGLYLKAHVVDNRYRFF